MLARIFFLLSLSTSLARLTPSNVPVPLVKGPTFAQLQDSRSDGYHNGLLDQHYGDNDENDYDGYDDYPYHHHHHYYQPEKHQTPLPSWVLPLIVLVITI